MGPGYLRTTATSITTATVTVLLSLQLCPLSSAAPRIKAATPSCRRRGPAAGLPCIYIVCVSMLYWRRQLAPLGQPEEHLYPPPPPHPFSPSPRYHIPHSVSHDRPGLAVAAEREGGDGGGGIEEAHHTCVLLSRGRAASGRHCLGPYGTLPGPG